MPRRPAPWFKASHRAWYVKIKGRLVRLGATEDEAWKEFHRLMAADEPAREQQPSSRRRLVEMVDAWLRSKVDVKENTLKIARTYAQSFLDSMPASTRAGDVRPEHVAAWLASHPGWSASTRQIAVRAVKAAYRWGEFEGWVARDPLARTKAPKADSRAPADMRVVELVLESVSPGAREILFFMYHTGARPGEAVGVTARDVDLERRVVRVEGKTGSRPVVVPSDYLPELAAIVEARPDGPLFRSVRGVAWTIDALQSQVRRARQRLGLGGGFVPYHLRGIFASGRIAAGVGDSLVGKMLGHTNPYTLHRHYHNPELETLQEAVDRRTRPGKKKARPKPGGSSTK